MTQRLRAPSTISPGATIQTDSGNYTVDANGFVTVADAYVSDLLNAGFTVPALFSGSQAVGANGIAETPLRLLDAFCQDGAPMQAAAAAGDFGVTCTPGTVLQLIGEAANNNTKTDKALWEFALPSNYVAGQDLALIVNAELNGAGTAGTKTIDASVYRQARDGTGTVDLCATDAQNLAAAAGDFTFAVTGATLNPGDVILVVVTIALQETAASALNAVINSARVA